MMIKELYAPKALKAMTLWSLFMVFFVREFMSLEHLGLSSSESLRTSALRTLSSQKESAIDTIRRIVPLNELAESSKTVECQEGFLPINDTILDPSLAFAGNRKIPRIVHLTGKSRCLVPELHANVEKWKLKDHSVFFHDDEAMNKLLYRDWPEFPQLKYVIRCLLYGGAVMADIWRILVLWEYGGIYADFDTSPHLFNESTITADDDAFFVIERLGTPSQWFMAASPRHPMIYFTMMSILTNIQSLDDIGNLPIVWTTGPGAVSAGWERFMGPGYKRPRGTPVMEGLYFGAFNRSVRLVGSQADENEYVYRDFFHKKGGNFNAVKNKVYNTMGMAHITTSGSRNPENFRNESCLWRMWHNEVQDASIWEPKW